MVEPSVQTGGSACFSEAYRNTPWGGGSNIWTLNFDGRSLSNKGLGISRTGKNEWQKGRSPQAHAKGWVKHRSKSWPDMPGMLTLLLDLGPEKKGMTEKRALLSKRKRTLCFSIIRTTWGFLVWMLRTRAWTGGPGTHHLKEPSGLFFEWRQGQCDFQ
jgi:hypothetical protein